MTETDSKPRDPHAMWWVEHQHLLVDIDNDYLIRGVDIEDEEDERKSKRLSELEHLLLGTEVTTFNGAKAVLTMVEFAIDRGMDVGQALLILQRFYGSIEHALERHGLEEQMQRWFWEENIPSAPVWRDHPGKPADAEAIWEAAHPLSTD